MDQDIFANHCIGSSQTSRIIKNIWSKFDIVSQVSNLAHEPLVIVICIFQLSNRSYLKGDVISLCQTAVSQVYLNLQPLYATDRKSAETLTVSHVHVMSAIVGILPKDQILQGNINCVYQFCLKVLDNPEVRTEEQGCLGLFKYQTTCMITVMPIIDLNFLFHMVYVCIVSFNKVNKTRNCFNILNASIT